MYFQLSQCPPPPPARWGGGLAARRSPGAAVDMLDKALLQLSLKTSPIWLVKYICGVVGFFLPEVIAYQHELV